MKQAITLTVSPRLREVLPPLTDEQRQRLEQNIVDDGEITDPVCYWFDGTDNVIVDGMNRFDIAAAHDMGYEIREMSFAGYEAVEMWMLERQAGKRNLTASQLSEVRGRLYNKIKASKADNLPDADLPKYQIDTLGKTLGKTKNSGKTTAETVAEQFDVSPATVKRDGKRVAIIDNLNEGVKSSLGKTVHDATMDDLTKLSKLDAGAQQTVARAVRVGQAKTLKEALKTVPAAAGKPKPPVKALEGREAEAFDARARVTGMFKTIAQWFVPIDEIRSLSPGKTGDLAQKQMDAVYQTLQKWAKEIK